MTVSPELGQRSGAALFARYAFPPNELGYCGPDGAEVLLAGGAAGARPDTGDLDVEVARRARLFDGAWPYLQLIAEGLGVEDPLDSRVVHAYWLGSEFLDAVPEAALARVARQQFGRQPGVPERLAADCGSTAAGPHHGFHVFVVYPWLGLLGKVSDVPRSVLDSCRIRWGRVTAVDGERATVRVPALRLHEGRLDLEAESAVQARWSSDGHAFVTGLQPGEQVAVHWDWICDRLDAVEVAALQRRTAMQLDAANRWLAQR